MSDIQSYLFETNAVKFCKEDNPFWYTSGKLGPYFINTHFLYGSEEQASELLKFIDECLLDKLSLPNKIFEKILVHYEENEIYHKVIDEMKDYIIKNIDVNEIDYVSGGERRDWFFSNIIAYLLDKPHISVFKDLSCVVSDSKFTSTENIDNISGKKVLHIADLVTTASSYIRAWIPAIRNLGGTMNWSCVIVDRMQGGRANIENEGTKFFAITNIDNSLFKTAFDNGIINESQLELLNRFFEDPDGTMKDFLINHPEFIENGLNSSNERTAKRAKALVDGNLYGLN